MNHNKLSNSTHFEIVYTPETPLKYPIKFFKQIGQDLLASRELAWWLMVRDIRAQYRQSLLGIAWAFLPPIVMAIVFTFVKNNKIIDLGVTDIPYPAYVMFSMVLWQTFADSLNAPIQAVASSKPLLARIRFPPEAIILAKIGEVFFNFSIKIFLVIGLFVWFQIPVGWTAFIAPIALIQLVTLGVCFGIFLAPIGALYQDVSKGLTLAMTFWLFLTPIVYPVPREGSFEALVNLNPVTPLLVTTRELATTGILSNPEGFAIVSIGSIVLLFWGWLVFRITLPFVIERISS